MTNTKAVARAVQILGGDVAAAAALEISRQAIAQMKSGEIPVSLDRAAEFEQLTNMAVTCEQIRPDKSRLLAYLRSRGSKTQD